MIHQAAAALADYALAVGIVDHGDEPVALGNLVELVERRHVAVHAEHAVSDEHAAPETGQVLFDHALGIGSITVLIDQYLGAGQAASVDDRGVIEPVGEDHILLAH